MIDWCVGELYVSFILACAFAPNGQVVSSVMCVSGRLCSKHEAWYICLYVISCHSTNTLFCQYL